MTETIYKKGDTLPLAVSLPTDLSTATAVTFHMRPYGDEDATPVTGTAVITDATEGNVEYQWGVGETDRTGLHDIEWQVEWSDGSLESFPKEGYDVLKFVEDID